MSPRRQGAGARCTTPSPPAKGEALKSRKNTVSAQVAAMKAKKEDATAVIAEMRGVADEIKSLDNALRTTEESLRALMLQIPNLPDPSVPDGTSPADNKPIAFWGEPPVIDFPPKPHWELMKSLGIIDFDRGTKITGAGFPVYVGKGARLNVPDCVLPRSRRPCRLTELLPLLVNAESATEQVSYLTKKGRCTSPRRTSSISCRQRTYR
jgi:seryl-tRNA synthetase